MQVTATQTGQSFWSVVLTFQARDRILLGRREETNALLPDEKRSVAVHESGHALVAALSPHADPVAKVTILPAGQALGVTEQLPEDERHLYSESYLEDSLAVRLGGRAAELLVFGEASSGAASDLVGATDLATRMVRDPRRRRGAGRDHRERRPGRAGAERRPVARRRRPATPAPTARGRGGPAVVTA